MTRDLYACAVKYPKPEPEWFLYKIGPDTTMDPPSRIPVSESKEDIVRYVRNNVGDIADILPIIIHDAERSYGGLQSRIYHISKKDIETQESSRAEDRGRSILLT